MFEYFVGRYLVNEGLMTRSKHDEIFARLKVVHTNLQKLKPEEQNLLENNQIALIQLLQNSINEKIGDLAFEYEGVKNEQLKTIMRNQQTISAIFFNQLIAENIIANDKLSAELEKFRTYYSLNSPGVSRNLKEDFDAILSKFVLCNDYFAKEYALIALKYILRFVGTRICFDDSYGTFSYSSERIALQKIVTNGKRYFLGISGSKPILQRFNDNIANSFAPIDKNARYGSLFSFLNCISNILQCLIARENEVQLVDAAGIYKYTTIFATENCFVLPLIIEDMKLDIVVGYGTRPNFATISHNI